MSLPLGGGIASAAAAAAARSPAAIWRATPRSRRAAAPCCWKNLRCGLVCTSARLGPGARHGMADPVPVAASAKPESRSSRLPPSPFLGRRPALLSPLLLLLLPLQPWEVWPSSSSRPISSASSSSSASLSAGSNAPCRLASRPVLFLAALSRTPCPREGAEGTPGDAAVPLGSSNACGWGARPPRPNSPISQSQYPCSCPSPC